MSPLFALILGCALFASSAASSPLTKSDLQTASKLFALDEESFGSIEDTLQSVRVMEVVTRGKAHSPATCRLLSQSIEKSPILEEASFYIKAASILNCPEGPDLAKIVKPVLLKSVTDTLELLPLYLATTALISMDKRGWINDDDKVGEKLQFVIQALEKLVQTDGTWKYTLSDRKSSVLPAGPGIEILASLIKLKAVDSNKVEGFKKSISKLFNKAILKDGYLYFPGSYEHNIPKIESTSAILRGVLALTSQIGQIEEVSVDKIFSAIKFVLSYGIKESSLGAPFDVIDIAGLSVENRWVVPLFFQFPSSYSISSKHFSVGVSDALGYTPADLSVKILSLSPLGKSAVIASNQELEYSSGNTFLTSLPSDELTVGIHTLKIWAESKNRRFTSGSVFQKLQFTDAVTVTNAKLALFDSDSKIPDPEISLKFGDSDKASLSATHLQKLTFSFQISLKSGSSLTPQQVFVYLNHESGIENIFLAKQTGNKFSVDFVFLELMQKLYHLSGTYTLKLAIGDSNIENSFVWSLAVVDLELPEAPDNSPKPPAPLPSLASKFGPKAEIHHIFRTPEKRPPANVSYAFSVLSLLPLLFFFAGLVYTGVNFKGFPSVPVYKLSALAFHGGILAILMLFVFFWFQLNLFDTLKFFVLLGIATLLPGYVTLSYLADSSSKLKTA